MKIKEAIEQLKWLCENDNGIATDTSMKEACQIAIQALEEIEWYMEFPNSPDIPINYCPFCGEKLLGK